MGSQAEGDKESRKVRGGWQCRPKATAWGHEGLAQTWGKGDSAKRGIS